MKKNVFVFAAAAAMAMGFASCDGFELDLGKDLLGNMEIVASNPVAGTADIEQYYADGDTLKFASAICNASFTTEVIEGVEVTIASNLMVGMETDLTTVRDENDIDLPFIGINLRDTLTGDHLITCPIHDVTFFQKVQEVCGEGDDINWMLLITRSNETFGHMVVLASDTAGIYVAYDGNINITKFQKMGKLIEGTLEDVKAAYISFAEVERMNNMSELELLQIGDLAEYFPSITLNGTINSRRANMTSVITALENQ